MSYHAEGHDENHALFGVEEGRCPLDEVPTVSTNGGGDHWVDESVLVCEGRDYGCPLQPG